MAASKNSSVYERFPHPVDVFLLLGILARVRHWNWSDYGWHKIELSKFWGTMLKVYGLTWIINIMYSIVLFQKGITPPSTDVYTQLLGNATPLTFILNLVLAGILAPIFEETLFRGVIFGGLQAYFGKWTSAILSAIFSHHCIFKRMDFSSFHPRINVSLFIR